MIAPMREAVITGRARLDNRDELLRELGPDADPAARAADLPLVRCAFLRWGPGCAGRLLGDFAFVVREPVRGMVFGARDHFGAVPFYYRASERGLAFALSASGVADDDGLPLEIDERRIADALVPELELVDRISTCFRWIHRLPAGYSLAYRDGRLTVGPYYEPPIPAAPRSGDVRSHAEAFRDVFREAVRCRLPDTGATMLSGGLDSSVITGFARRIRECAGGPALSTLSAVTDDPGCEESHHVRAVLREGRFDPITIRPKDVPDFRDVIERFFATIEEPFDALMMIPLLLYGSARRAGHDVVLDGVDGDIVASHEPDVLAGVIRAGALGAAFREARGIARFYDTTYAPWSSVTAVFGRQAARAWTPEIVKRAFSPTRHGWWIRTAIARSLIRPEFAARSGVPDRLRHAWAHRAGERMLSPGELLAREVRHPQVAAALERYFRVAASQGVEARHPFFDKRVVELCLSLPWNARLRDGWTKRVVREAAEGILPDEVRWRKGRWVRLGGTFLRAVARDHRELMERELAGNMDAISEFVDIARVRRLIAGYRQGDHRNGEALWTVAVLSSWLRKTGSRKYDGTARLNGLAALPAAP